MKHRIETFQETNCVGVKLSMSIKENQTAELWQNFMSRKHQIIDTPDNDLISIEVYPNLDFFRHFSIDNEFEKWAAVKIKKESRFPADLDEITIPTGQYVVFDYKGKASDGQAAYQYIFTEWLPNSEYVLDERPHFALMGEKYKGESDDSEEEIWIPIKKK